MFNNPVFLSAAEDGQYSIILRTSGNYLVMYKEYDKYGDGELWINISGGRTVKYLEWLQIGD